MSGGVPQRFPQQSQSSSLRLPSPAGMFGFSSRTSPKQAAVEGRPSPARSGANTVCETCQQPVDPLLHNICRGCNLHAHRDCHEMLSIGDLEDGDVCVLYTSCETLTSYSESH